MIRVNSKWALVVVSSALLSLQAGAHASTINYTQTWQTKGTQAGSNNIAFASYTGWRYYEAANDNFSLNARVDNVGELSLGSTATASYVTALITSQTLASTSTFDLSTTPLVVSVDAGSRYAGNPANYSGRSIGLVVGNVTFLIYPGTDVYHVESYNRSTTYVNGTLGFTPPPLASNPDPSDVFAHMAVTVLAVGSNYHFEYSIGSFTSTIDLPIATVGDISSVGLRVTGAGGGYFHNFAVTQSDAVAAPTPAALPAGLCLLSGMAAARRRRR